LRLSDLNKETTYLLTYLYKIGWCCQNLSSLDLNVLTVSHNTTWLGKIFQTSSALLVKEYLRKW